MLTVRKVGSIIEKLKEMLEEYLKKTKPKYYPPVENLLDLGYEHYTEMTSVFSGLRPGEKLYEELSYDMAEFDKTRYKDIFVEKPEVFDEIVIHDELEKLKQIVDSGTMAEVIEQLKIIVPDYHPNRETNI